MAHLLNNHVPTGGMLFRSGGEEFSMIIPDLSFDKTVRLAEAIRNSVERSNFHVNDTETVHLTVSIGVGYQFVAPATKGRLLKEADDMLHAAKNRGRTASCSTQYKKTGIAYGNPGPNLLLRRGS